MLSGRGPQMLMLPLYLHINQKSNEDDEITTDTLANSADPDESSGSTLSAN